jgi:hypothetical protein
VLPSVKSAWVAKVKTVPGASFSSSSIRTPAAGLGGKRTPPGAIQESYSQNGKGSNADAILSSPPPVETSENAGSFSKTSGAPAAGTSNGSGTSPASAAGNKFANRARQLKMHENMSEAALKRWEAMDEVEQKAMTQVNA